VNYEALCASLLLKDKKPVPVNKEGLFILVNIDDLAKSPQMSFFINFASVISTG
jgi:hypothetical protein